MKLRLNLDALLFPDGYDLLSACKHDDIERVKSLLAANPTLVYYSGLFSGQTGWHQAAVHGSCTVLEELALYVQRHREKLSRYYFAKAGCFQTSRLNFKGGEILKAVNQQNNRQQSALMLAAAASQPDCVRVLIRAGADLSARDSGLRTALHYAAYSGCSGSCAQIIAGAQEAAGTHPRSAHQVARFVDKRTICGFTALHYAVYHGHVDCAQQLLFAGASLLARCTWSGAVESIWCDPQCTPLHLAARTANATMVKLLLQALISRFGSLTVPRNLDPRAQRDRSGRQPYHYVLLARPHSSLVHLLHPGTPLGDAFTAEELAAILVEPSPSLAQLAAAAHRVHLQAQLQALLPGGDRQQQDVEGEAQLGDSCAAWEPGMRPECAAVEDACGSSSSSGAVSTTSSSGCGEGASSSSGSGSFDAASSGDGVRSRVASGRTRSGTGGLARTHDEDSCGGASSSSTSSIQQLQAAEHDGCAAGGHCGVCWTQQPTVQLNSCGHELCGTCSQKICEVEAPKVPLCPFCRGTIRSFAPCDPSRPSLELPTTAPSQPCTASSS